MTRRPLTALILAVLLGLASVTMAVARGQAPGVMSVTLCSDLGPQTIVLDAEGKPTGQTHPCPDCTVSQGLALLPEATRLPILLQRFATLQRADPDVASGRQTLTLRARGPPFAG